MGDPLVETGGGLRLREGRLSDGVPGAHLLYQGDGALNCTNIGARFQRRRGRPSVALHALLASLTPDLRSLSSSPRLASRTSRSTYDTDQALLCIAAFTTTWASQDLQAALHPGLSSVSTSPPSPPRLSSRSSSLVTHARTPAVAPTLPQAVDVELRDARRTRTSGP